MFGCFSSGMITHLLCGLGFASLCSAIPIGADAIATTVMTSIGSMSGMAGPLATRYSIPYAMPPVGERRFQDPLARTSLVNYNASRVPPACPQLGDMPTSEDCLYATIYTPKGATATSKLPVLFWIHGGSFIAGASSTYVLDGSDLSSKQQVIVVVVQYRLGVLGWMVNSQLGIEGNYGLKDVLLALNFVNTNIAAFGGDPNRVTLAGQSSGAEMVKSLLVTPSATSLFARAILHSPPLDFSDFSVSLASSVGVNTAAQLNCSSSLACLRQASVTSILELQANMNKLGQNGGLQGVRAIEPVYRTVVDEERGHPSLGCQEESTDFDMQDEGALTAAHIFPSPTPVSIFPALIGQLYPERAKEILGSSLYDPTRLTGDDDATRDAFSQVGTDFVFTCPVQQVALNLTRSGYRVYQAQFNLGISYYNDSIPYLIGKASHQDDIKLLFHPTSIGLTRAQRALTSEVQARWGQFARTGSPNTDSYTAWVPVSNGTALNILVFGSDAYHGSSNVTNVQRPAACSLGSGLWKPL